MNPVEYPAPEYGVEKSCISPGSLDVVQRLQHAGFDGYLVGGCVRDLVLGRTPKDFDVATNAHPEQVQPYCWQNPRFVFFQETSGGPFGSINVPVTPFRSLATDKSVFPRACLAFIDTQLPMLSSNSVRTVPYGGFVLDQDTGGAIRAAGRSDI